MDSKPSFLKRTFKNVDATMLRLVVVVALLTSAMAMLMSALLYRGTIDGRVDHTIVKEEICSRTHQGEPCRELMNRLWFNMTPAQKLWVACGALATLSDKDTIPVYKRQCR